MLVNLEELRKKYGLTQEEISAKVEIARSSYANIENGERRPSVNTAKRIAAVLGFDWTLFYEENPAEGGAE